MKNGEQWWILGEANEAVASDSPFFGTSLKIAHTVSIRCRCLFRGNDQVGTKSGKCTERFLVKTFFFKEHPNFGTKIGKSEIKS